MNITVNNPKKNGPICFFNVYLSIKFIISKNSNYSNVSNVSNVSIVSIVSIVSKISLVNKIYHKDVIFNWYQISFVKQIL